MNFSDTIVRSIRTWVPVAVGAFLSTFPWVEDLVDINEAALAFVVVGLYYTAVAWLENNVHPAFGWLLGRPKSL